MYCRIEYDNSILPVDLYSYQLKNFLSAGRNKIQISFTDAYA